MYENFFWFLLIIPLATWRITHILYVPEHIADFLHDWVGRKQDSMGLPTYPDTWLAYLIQCPLCLSMWVGLACVIAWAVYPYVLLPFVASALTIFIEDKRRG